MIYTKLSTGFPLRLVGLCLVSRREFSRQEDQGKKYTGKKISTFGEKKTYRVSCPYICAKLTLCREESLYRRGNAREVPSSEHVCKPRIPSATVLF